jgi:hypothetical protein
MLREFQKKGLKISTKRKKRFGKTSEVMEEFCSAICVTGISRPTAGKNNGDVKFPNGGSVSITGHTSCCLKDSFQRVSSFIQTTKQNHLCVWPSVSLELSNLDPHFTSLLSCKQQHHLSRQIVQVCLWPFVAFFFISSSSPLFYWCMESPQMSLPSHTFSFLFQYSNHFSKSSQSGPSFGPFDFNSRNFLDIVYIHSFNIAKQL